MKLILNLVILALLFSCAEKKNKEDTKKNWQTIETGIEPDLTSERITSEIEQEDSIRRPIQKSEVFSALGSIDAMKAHMDSVTIAAKQMTQKHKGIPPDGEYIYDIAYTEWQGKSMGEKVLVVIRGNTIKIVSEGNPSMTAKKGKVLDKGVLIKHNKTGDWLITNNPSHANLEAYGGCVGIAMVIDFINKKYWTC